MTKMKSYTDIEQSKVLADILPIESADMSYSIIHNIGQEPYRCNVPTFTYVANGDIPCWSLTALIEALPKIYELKPLIDLEGNLIMYSGLDIDVSADNIIDACVEMLIKLHELKML